MATQNLLNANLQVNAIVSIAKKSVNFVSLNLDQVYGDHHTFSLTLDYDVLDKSFMSNPVKQFELIGEAISIEFMHGADIGNAYMFEGTITNVKNIGREGKHGYVVLEGASPTILLEQGKRMEVYSEMGLRKIFEEVSSRISSTHLKTANNPLLTSNIDFLMQYNESDWAFLQRIAYLYGENLFFSGTELLFGDYEEWDPVKLTYDVEIENYEFCSRLLPNSFVNYQYLSEEDSTLEKPAPEDVSAGDNYVKKTTQRSQDLMSAKMPRMPLEVPASDKSVLDEIVERKKIRTAAQTVMIVGESKTYKASIGRIIKISLAEGISTKEDLGTYRVVKCRHVIDQNHRYKNYFEAVPSVLKTMPMPEIPMPVVHSMVGTVKGNNDPKGLGRIQVDFPFAENHNHSWLRVMSPDAGSSDKVAKSRGMMFIPEVGDQVMVGFEFSDPNRPYVMGSMFHGKNTGGGGDGNKTKSLSTRSGSAVTLDDDKGSAELKDPSGNILMLDGNGNASLTAPESITFTVGESSITMKKDGSIDIKSGENCTINMTINSMGLTTTDGALTITNKSTGLTATESGITLNSKGGLTLVEKDSDLSINAKGNVVIKGKQVDIN